MKNLFYEDLFLHEKNPVIGIDSTESIVYMNSSGKIFFLCEHNESKNLQAADIFEIFDFEKLLSSFSPKNYTVQLVLKNNHKKTTFGLFNIPKLAGKKSIIFLVATEPNNNSDLKFLMNNLAFNTFFENPLYGIIVFSPASFKIFKYNTAAKKMLQINPKKHRMITALFKENDDKAFSILLDDVLSEKKSIPHPYCIELKRDKNFPLRILVSLNILEPKTEKIGLLTISDITFQKIEELRISQAEDRYRGLVELSPEGMMVLIKNRIVYSNLSGVSILGGNSVIDVIHLNILKFIAPAYKNIIKEDFAGILQKNQAGEKREIIINRLDGKPIFVDYMGVPVYYENQKAIQLILRDITERKRAEAILKESERQYKDMFINHTTPRLIIDAHNKGKIFDANNAAALLYDYPIDELKKMSFNEINTLPGNVVEKELTMAINGVKFFFEFQHRTASGRIIYVEVHSTPITIKNRDMLYSVIHDVTGRKNIESERELLILELEAANKKLKELSIMKEEFLSVASHDLRSPFTAILGFSQILMDDESLEPQKRNFAERIYRSANTQLSYVNDLLQTIKLETGEIKLNKSLVNINDVIVESVDILSILATKKNIKIRTQFLFNTQVYLDRDKISQVINNVLSNAIKFTPQDCAILIETDSDNPDDFFIRFKDEGKGISQKNMKILFDKYNKISTSGTDGETGTGLGLAITKNLIDLHNGTITVKSRINRGSTFTITLPIEKSASF